MAQIAIIILLLIGVHFCQFRYPFISIFRSENNSETRHTGYVLDYRTTTAIKGLSMLFILVGHISGTFGTVIYSPLPPIGVFLFLFLSGFGLCESQRKNGLSSFWIKKITRVLIPYAIVITGVWIFSQYEFDLWKYILEITGLKTSYWYIAFQMKWYIVFFIVMSIIPNRTIELLAVVGVVLFFTQDAIEIEQVIAFPLGAVASKYKSSLQNFPRKYLWWILITSMIIGTMFLGIRQIAVIRSIIDSPIYCGIYLLQNCAFSIAVITLFSLFRSLSKSTLLIYSGVVSYEMYLLHFPFYGMTDGRIELAIILVIASLIAAAIFYSFNNKLAKTMTNIINRLKTKNA